MSTQLNLLDYTPPPEVVVELPTPVSAKTKEDLARIQWWQGQADYYLRIMGYVMENVQHDRTHNPEQYKQLQAMRREHISRLHRLRTEALEIVSSLSR